MNEFDFIKEFGGADPLRVEAVGMLIGHAVAALFKGMVEAGMSEANAHKVIRSAMDSMMRNMFPVPS